MTDIPFVMLTFVTAITIILPLLAYLFRTSFPPSFVMWLGGIIWILIFLSTNNVDLGEINTSQTYTNSTSTINNIYTCNCYAIRDPVTFQPTLLGILFIMLALVYILIGVLAERGT